jgi:hypothetical protein
MKKANPLKDALNKQENPQPEVKAAEVASIVSDKTRKQASRVGRVFVGGFFAPEVQTEIKIIAATERTTVQELIAEGINAVLARRQRPQIANVSPQDNK